MQLIDYRKGFTLIEVLIVLAIMSAAIAIAIPTYSQNMIRSKAIELLRVASSAQSKMADYIITHNVFPSDATDAGITLITTDLLSSITVNNSGMISLTSNPENLGANLTLHLQAVVSSGAVQWVCSSSGQVEFAPSNCRN